MCAVALFSPGIGWTMVAMCVLCNTYYMMLMAYGIVFMCASFTAQLPWATCDHWWNTLGRSKDKSKDIGQVHDVVMTLSNVPLIRGRNDNKLGYKQTKI